MGFLFQDTGAASSTAGASQEAIEEARKQQQNLGQMLQQQYASQGPSAGVGLLERGSEEAIKRAAGALASQRGINPALAQRLASQQAAQQTQEAAQQAGILRAQELASRQQAALSGLQNVYGQMGQQAVSQYGIAQQALSEQQRANQQRTGQLLGGALSGLGAIGAKVFGLAEGGTVPGKAEVDGDSYANDKVPAMLSPGEIVIPRSKAKNPDKAKEFIDQLMSKESVDNKEVSYADILAMQKQLATLIKKLEKK